MPPSKSCYFLIILILPLFLTVLTAKPIIFVKTDKQTYTLGETVTVTVSVYIGGRPKSHALVGIEVRDPLNMPKYVDQGFTNNKGVIVFKFRIMKSWKAGKYTVYVSTPGSTASCTFEVKTKVTEAKITFIFVSSSGRLLFIPLKVYIDNEIYTISNASITLTLKLGVHHVKVYYSGIKVFDGSYNISSKNLTTGYGSLSALLVRCNISTLVIRAVDWFNEPITNLRVIIYSNNIRVENSTDQHGVAIFSYLPHGVYKLTYDNKEQTIVINKDKEVKIMLQPSIYKLTTIVLSIILAFIVIVFVIKRILEKHSKS